MQDKDARQIQAISEKLSELAASCSELPPAPQTAALRDGLRGLEEAVSRFARGFIDFRDIVDHLPYEFYITDGEGRTLYINEAYSKGTGIQWKDVIGKRVDELEQLFTEPVVPLVIAQRKIVQTLATVKTVNKQVLLTGVPIFDAEENLKYVVANDHDSAYIRRLQEQFDTLQAAKSKDDAEIRYLRGLQNGQRELCFRSKAMGRIMELVEQIAPVNATVLITGESGTGKEVIADAIYQRSSRVNKPFIKINCAAIPPQLLESELFGYEEGAFTGANKKGKMGMLELANHGTIFLDEIGDMSMDLQSKMLRALQQQEIIRVGGKKAIKLDLRIIAATNKNLPEEVREKRFREDLYYRLNVVPIQLPALRERSEDIKPLTEHFLALFCKRYHKDISITADAVKCFLSYPWPGNIRELENFVERLVVIHTGKRVTRQDVLPLLNLPVQGDTPSYPEMDTLKHTVQAVERDCILRAIRNYGSKRKAAKALGISHSTLVLKCQQLGINELLDPRAVQSTDLR